VGIGEGAGVVVKFVEFGATVVLGGAVVVFGLGAGDGAGVGAGFGDGAGAGLGESPHPCSIAQPTKAAPQAIDLRSIIVMTGR